MEVNKEEALRCLHISQKHRNAANLPSALKFAKKSVSLYTTPEGEAMVTIIERQILVQEKEASGSGSTSTSTANASGTNGDAKATGVEEHVTSAHRRPAAAAAAAAEGSKSASASTSAGGGAPAPKKREYTVKQIEVVRRVKACKHHQYYEILAVEKTCSENDVKKAYKKLALALHPDKNGAPGADEAFKMVSKAFSVLSDPNTRAAFDSNPTADPTSRNAGMSSGMRSGFSGGGQGMGGDINPEDLFNMFFGGGMGGGSPFGGGGANVFTFGGGNGFQAQYAGRPRPRRQGGNGQPVVETSPLIALLPIILLFIFAFISVLPSIFGSSSQPDPGYTFEPMGKYNLGRHTFQRGIPYFVHQPEFEQSSIWQSIPEEKRVGKGAVLASTKARVFEIGVENSYINRLRNECNDFEMIRRQRINEEAGIFGFGTDYDKIRELQQQKSPSCEQLRDWGLMQTQAQRLF